MVVRGSFVPHYSHVTEVTKIKLSCNDVEEVPVMLLCLLEAHELIIEISNEHLVDVAPFPIFTRLNRSNYGMIRRVKVFCCVFVLGRITTTDMPTSQTLA